MIGQHNNIINLSNPNLILKNPTITLSTISRNIERYKQPISNTVIGIVTDCTKPLYRAKQKNYIVQLKIIDQSLNDKNIFGVMCKDCTVYLLNKSKKKLQLVSKIGEIVILDKFTFTLWNGIKLETKYLHLTEGLYVIDQNQEPGVKCGLSMNPQLFQFSENHKQRIQQLRKWRFQQMHNNFQLKLGINILNNHCAMIEPFNILLRLCESLIPSNQRSAQQIKNNTYSRIILTDVNGNIYRLHKEENLSGADEEIEIQDYVILQEENQPIAPIAKKGVFQVLFNQLSSKINGPKSAKNSQKDVLILIRGIQSIHQNLEITLTQTGNILGVVYNFPNSQFYMNYMGIHREGEKSLMNLKSSEPNEIHPKIAQLMQEDNSMQYLNLNKPLTVITQYYNTKSITYIHQLLQLQDRYNHTTKKEQILIMDTYLIQVLAIRHRGNLSLYHRQYQILLHNNFYKELTQEEKKQCIQYKKIGYIYEGSLFVLDRSTENKGKLLQIRLFNCDESGNFLANQNKQFTIAQQAIDNEKSNGKERDKLKKMIEQKLDGLCKFTRFQRMVSLIVEPIRSQKLLFRLVNTKIL